MIIYCFDKLSTTKLAMCVKFTFETFEKRFVLMFNFSFILRNFTRFALQRQLVSEAKMPEMK